jgi:hypothetical protein
MGYKDIFCDLSHMGRVEMTPFFIKRERVRVVDLLQ